MTRARSGLVLMYPLFVCLTPNALACGFRDGEANVKTLRQEAAAADFVLVGTMENATEGPDGDGTDFVVAERLKGHPALGDLKIIRVPRCVKVPGATQPPTFLVFGEVVKGEPDVYRGDVASPEFVGYVKGLLAIDAKDTVKLMRYAFGFLDHKEPEVADDAYRQFTTSTDPDIRTAARALAPEKLRAWLLDETTPPRRLRLYGYLLGNCGTRDDATLLRKLLGRLTTSADGGPLCDGIVTGYTLLDPNAGWAYARDLVKRPDADFTVRYSVLRAARYFHTTHPDVVTTQDVLGVMALLVAQPDMADLPITDLRQWKCWELTDTILALFEKQGFAEKVVRRSIVRYALRCPDPRTAQFIAGLREADPAIVEAAEEFLKNEHKPGR